MIYLKKKEWIPKTMSYDFDTIKDRSGTYSIKWNISDGELPMWVADMDFETAPEIKQAIVERARHGIFGYSYVPDEWYDAYKCCKSAIHC